MNCESCGLDHKFPNEMHLCRAALSAALAKLVSSVGMPGKCRGCEADIFWVRHMNGKTVPYTPVGQNHFIDCPKAKDFKK